MDGWDGTWKIPTENIHRLEQYYSANAMHHQADSWFIWKGETFLPILRKCQESHYHHTTFDWDQSRLPMSPSCTSWKKSMGLTSLSTIHLVRDLHFTHPASFTKSDHESFVSVFVTSEISLVQYRIFISTCISVYHINNASAYTVTSASNALALIAFAVLLETAILTEAWSLQGVHVIKNKIEYEKMKNIVVRHGEDFLVQEAIVSKEEFTHNVRQSSRASGMHGNNLFPAKCLVWVCIFTNSLGWIACNIESNSVEVEASMNLSVPVGAWIESEINIVRTPDFGCQDLCHNHVHTRL